jgi:iron complex outermembrane recepter protein
MKKPVFICCLILSYHITYAQNRITGKIVDQNNLPLVAATIFVPDLNKGTISDESGKYELQNLPDGKIKIQFSFIGCINQIETIELNGQAIKLDIMLKQSFVEVDEIVVTGGYNSTQHENAVKIEILKLDPEEIKITPNFSEILTRVPGVDMISKGSGVSKPVIRGLSMNDILVLNNGVRFENYQYSDHHPLGIDEFGIENVEIIKGPASLLYGSDAIGGVINFIKEKPAAIGTVAGDYNMQLFSNSLGITNNFGIKGASKKFFGGIRVGQKSNADYLQGGGEYLPNSRFNEYSVKANAGFTDKIGTFKLYYDFNNQKLGLAEPEAIAGISVRGRKTQIFYEELNTHLLSSQNKLYLGKFKLDLNTAWQNTELIHFGELNIYEIQMRLATLSYEAKLYLPSDTKSEYIIGFQGFNQNNTNLNNRQTILLPDAATNNYSVFGLLQHTFFRKLKLQTGVRYDRKSISTLSIGIPSDSQTFRPALDKYYGSFSGSFGATYNLTDELLFRANIAAGYRTPNLAELTSKGPHELRFEIGDPNLVPENSLESDLSFHYHKTNITFDLAGFYNRINHYIFISPTGGETETGIPIFRYKQANSNLYGGEAGFHIHPEPVRWLHFETTFSSVIGKQENGDFLPFIPAHKLQFELRAEKEKFLFLNKAYLAFHSLTAFDQNRPAPDETSTPGYTLLDIATGGNIRIKNQMISVSIQVNNLLDKKYIDHLSTLKEVNAFNPGRNISFNLRVPFSLAN